MDSHNLAHDVKIETSSQKSYSSISITIILLFTFFVFAGGIYNEVIDPSFRGGENGKPFLIYPHADHQFLAEGILASLLIFIGFLGIFLIHRVSMMDNNRIQYQILGFVLTVSSLLILQIMFNQKI